MPGTNCRGLVAPRLSKILGGSYLGAAVAARQGTSISSGSHHRIPCVVCSIINVISSAVANRAGVRRSFTVLSSVMVCRAVGLGG